MMSKPLKPVQAAALAFEVVKHLLETYDEEKGMSLAAHATLLAALAEPGSTQRDLYAVVDSGVTPGAFSKQLDLLEGRNSSSTRPRFIYKSRNEVNRKENDVIVTEDGVQFTADLAKRLNRRLKQWDDN
jgi:DNA-binding MarR family transcriptional regulator